MNVFRTTAVLAAALLVSVTLSGCAAPKPTLAPSTTTSADAATAVHDGEQWILFQSSNTCQAGGPDPTSICLQRLDGSGRHRVVDKTGELLHPDWSPDGTHVVYTAAGQEIWTAAVDGSGQKKIADCGPFAGCNGLDYPAWSPDGKTVAFTVYDGAPLAQGPPAKDELALVDLASGKFTELAQTAPLELVDQPRWSPDGTRLAVQVEQFDGSGNESGAAIGIVSVAGGVPTTITPFSAFATYPDWSPTSDRIVYVTNDVNPAGGPIDLNLVDSDGANPVRVTYAGSDAVESKHPSWTPDGAHVIFVQWQTHRLAEIDADGFGYTQLDATGTHPRVRPVP
jgi:Tol biopolymer transport system component